MKIQDNLISSKELAKVLSISTATVTYYTNLGLFKIKDRKGNIRLYDKRETASVFERIHQMRKEGYSLRLIQQRFEKGYSV